MDDEENYVEVEWIKTGKTEILNLNELDPAIQAVGPASSTPDDIGAGVNDEAHEELPREDNEDEPAKVNSVL